MTARIRAARYLPLSVALLLMGTTLKADPDTREAAACPGVVLADGATCRVETEFPCVDPEGSDRLGCTFEASYPYPSARLEWERPERDDASCGGSETRLLSHRLIERRKGARRRVVATLTDHCGEAGTVVRVRPLRRVAFNGTAEIMVPVLDTCESHTGRCDWDRGYREVIIELRRDGIEASARCTAGEMFLPVHGCVREPSAVITAAPALSRQVRASGREGAVTLEMIIDASGHTRHVRVLESEIGDAAFEEAVAAAVSDWTYTPPRLDGRPFELYWKVRAHFSRQ